MTVYAPQVFNPAQALLPAAEKIKKDLAAGEGRMLNQPDLVIAKFPKLGSLRGYDLWDGMIGAHGSTPDYKDGGGVYPSNGKMPIKTRIGFDLLDDEIKQTLLQKPALFLGFVNKGKGDYWSDHYAQDNATWSQQHISGDVFGGILKIVALAAGAYFGLSAIMGAASTATAATATVGAGSTFSGTVAAAQAATAAELSTAATAGGLLGAVSPTAAATLAASEATIASVSTIGFAGSATFAGSVAAASAANGYSLISAANGYSGGGILDTLNSITDSPLYNTASQAKSVIDAGLKVQGAVDAKNSASMQQQQADLINAQVAAQAADQAAIDSATAELQALQTQGQAATPAATTPLLIGAGLAALLFFI